MDIRIRQAERRQTGFELVDLESLVVEDHPVRAVWSFVEGLDLQVFYDRIKARGETPGRPNGRPMTGSAKQSIPSSFRGVRSTSYDAQLRI